jgi:hypothetical protein
MARNGSDQPNIENLKLDNGENNQQAVAGDGPPKTAKQLAKEAEKAEKLRKFEEKQKAKEQAEKEKKEKAASGKEKTKPPDITEYTSPTAPGEKKGIKIKHSFQIFHLFILQIFIVNYLKVIVQNMSKQLGILGGKIKVFFVLNIMMNILQLMLLHHEKILLWLFHHQM